MYKDAKVTTADGKDIGKVTQFDKKRITVYKKGFLRDEEIDIPISAIIACNYEKKIGGNNDGAIPSLILNLKEDELKHGFEFMGENKPNSDFIHGKDNFSFEIPTEKEKVHYEPFSDSKPVNPLLSQDKLPSEKEYICDMCSQRFKDIDKFEEHRRKKHFAAVGI